MEIKIDFIGIMQYMQYKGMNIIPFFSIIIQKFA